MRPANGEVDRLLDLLADRAGGEPLIPEDEREVNRLLALHPEIDPATFERTAAAIHLAFLDSRLEPMPSALRSRVLDQAESFFQTEELARGSRPVSTAWIGWLAAAAAVLVLVLKSGGPQSPSGPSIDEVGRAGDAQVASWNATKDPGGAGVTGDVVWSCELQSGYMRFRGLAKNDPGEGQYQLWIFDADRPAEYPVDGGVFDSTGGEVQVPIDAKIAVAEPTLFAITYERPGGVVVSTRERLLLTASPQ